MSRYLGHSEGQSMTARYVHLDWDELQPVADALDLFDSGVDPRTAPCSKNAESGNTTNTQGMVG